MNQKQRQKRARIVASIYTLILFFFVAIGWMALGIGLFLGAGGDFGGYGAGPSQPHYTLVQNLAWIAGFILGIFFLVFCWKYFYKRSMIKSAE